MKLHFTKMQAFGNDYIYMDTMTQVVPRPEGLAKRLCDRHFGIGADGLILVCPSEKADFRMRVFDPDGTEAQMCGNGLRSVAKYVFDKEFTKKSAFTVETLGGIRQVYLVFEEGRLQSVRADIGRPCFEPEAIPLNASAPCIEKPIRLQGHLFYLTALSLGNPHGVCFLEPEFDLEAFDLPRFGSLLENHTLFPERANIEFCKALDAQTLSMRSWERGTGETLSCATGCAASTVVGHLTGRCGRDVRVLQRGGTMHIEWKANDHLIMTAPTYTVFEGTLEWREEPK